MGTINENGETMEGGRFAKQVFNYPAKIGEPLFGAGNGGRDGLSTTEPEQACRLMLEGV